MKEYKIIGMMSGTSLDGVDLAHCTFIEDQNGYSFQIGACETVPYPETWLTRIKTLPNASALEFVEAHTSYGKYIGELIHKFQLRNQLTTDFVASHGHTIFHNPAKHYTSQIGEGAAIAAQCGLPVVCDFRTGDVAAGGQGAPLVPIGDQLLFSEYDYCLNLGGFANISMQVDGKRIAFDICPVNIILNFFAGKAGKLFDKDGEMASSGRVHTDLLETLNSIRYYQMKPPKSLGREWIEKEIFPMLSLYNISIEDAACTFCEHIAIQIASCLDVDPAHQILVTGGGAFNFYLITRLVAHTKVNLIIPDSNTINYKEALVFAFLGLLRMKSSANCLSSVTGATHDVSGGAIYLP